MTDKTPEKMEEFVAALMDGKAPGSAARQIGIARSTAYRWRDDDPEFKAAWDNAAATSLDELETTWYDIAMTDRSERAIENILKARRREVYGDSERALNHNINNNLFLGMSLQEHYQMIERLGLPTPVIESDEIDEVK